MIFFNSSVVYQNSRAFERRFKLHPLVQNLLDNVLIFTKLSLKKDINGRITSTVSTLEEDVNFHRKSTTHLEGRAFDFSVKDLDEQEIYNLKVAFQNVAGHLGAWQSGGGKTDYKYRCLIVDHDIGLGRHLHFQIGKDIAQNFKD